MANELREAALSYAARGWRVFPLRPRTKEPATPHGFKDATCDTSTIGRWWDSMPDANVGIATGDGLLVLDVDDKPGHEVQGSDSLREWELEHGELSDTCRAVTGSGGVHYRRGGRRGAVQPERGAGDRHQVRRRLHRGAAVRPPQRQPLRVGRVTRGHAASGGQRGRQGLHPVAVRQPHGRGVRQRRQVHRAGEGPRGTTRCTRWRARCAPRRCRSPPSWRR